MEPIEVTGEVADDSFDLDNTGTTSDERQWVGIYLHL